MRQPPLSANPFSKPPIKGGSRHNRNRHNRRNRQNCHGRLLALYFVGQAKGGQGALQNRQNRQNSHEGYPPETQPPFSVILIFYGSNMRKIGMTGFVRDGFGCIPFTRFFLCASQEPKKGINIKNLGRNPPFQTPPPKGPLTPRILYVRGLFSLQYTRKRPT